MSNFDKDRLRPVESILVTQLTTQNNQAPYDRLIEKYGLRIDYRPFTEIMAVSAKDFRKQKVSLEEYSAVVLTSKNAVDHFFRLCEEMRYKVPEDQKYFCSSEAIALYLQKHITYRKRKVFFGKQSLHDLKPTLVKLKKKETFLMPCANFEPSALTTFFKENEFNYKEAIMYNAASCDIKDLKNVFYDILVFFSPLSLDSLYENFPDFKQNNTRIAAYGEKTAQAILNRGLILDIPAPTAEAPSMATAIELYLKQIKEVAK